MPRREQEEAGKQPNEQQADSQVAQPETSAQEPAMEQLLTTLNQVFATFAQRSLDQPPQEPFNDFAIRAVEMFHDIVERLQFRVP